MERASQEEANALSRPILYARENADGMQAVITVDYDYMDRRVFKKVATRPLAIQKDGTWYSAPTRPATQGSPSQVCSGLGGWLLKPHPAYGLDLVYYNYRHYTPLDGRWCGRDRIAEAGGYNLNIYASNLPLNAWDNLGLFLDFLYSDDKGSLKAGTYEVTSPVPVIGGFPFGTVTIGTPDKSDGGKQSITLAIGITWGISFLNKF